MRKKILFLAAPLFIIGLFYLFLNSSLSQKGGGEKKILLGSIEITVEVADTEEKRSQGLSGRTSLPQNGGMLFVFPQKNRHSFWMKEMKFPLDFIWIDGNQVVDITYDVPYPKDEEAVHSLVPEFPVDKVLEINAGGVNLSGVKIGDQVSGL